MPAPWPAPPASRDESRMLLAAYFREAHAGVHAIMRELDGVVLPQQRCATMLAAASLMRACCRIFDALHPHRARFQRRASNHLYIVERLDTGRISCRVTMRARPVCPGEGQTVAPRTPGAPPSVQGMGGYPPEKIVEQFIAAPPPRTAKSGRGAPLGNRNALKTGMRSADLHALRARVRVLRRAIAAAIALHRALAAAERLGRQNVQPPAAQGSRAARPAPRRRLPPLPGRGASARGLCTRTAFGVGMPSPRPAAARWRAAARGPPRVNCAWRTPASAAGHARFSPPAGASQNAR